jgi:hypothetical protein
MKNLDFKTKIRNIELLSQPRNVFSKATIITKSKNLYLINNNFLTKDQIIIK